MILFRSILFAIAFYLNCVFWFIVAMAGYVLPLSWYYKIAFCWTRTSVWLHKTITGCRVEYRGVERIPKGALIVACKHQSTWETVGIYSFFAKPTYILKRELMWIPFLGWHLYGLGQIGINRTRGAEALAALTAAGRKAMAEDRQILIFPEGTRRSVGAPPDYKFGVARLYGALNVPVLPIAHNAGLSWPRRRFRKYPYTVICEFLEPIQPGLPMTEFHKLLQQRIEEASNRLVAESLAEKGHSLSDIQASVES